MSRHLSSSLIIILLLFASVAAIAQAGGKWDGFGIEANIFEGKVVKHTAKFLLPVPRQSSGLDLNFLWKTFGRKPWHQRRRYPTLGLGITYTNYGIDSIYGRCFSLYPNIVIPLISGKHIEWTMRIGDGVGYVTKSYSRISPFDTINNAIGSHVNDYASFMIDLRYHINTHLDLQAGVNFSHISDASFHQPNLGINLVGSHVGLRYFPVSSSPTHIVRTQPHLKNRWLLEGRLSLAATASNAPLGPAYPVYLAALYASKRRISKNKAFFGIDYSYHTGIYNYMRNNMGFVPEGTERSLAYKSAIFAGNEFLLGRVGVVLQVGGYIHQAFLTQGKIYEKLGGNLYLVQRERGAVKEFFLCGFLKTHLSVAELAEFGFGMGF